MYSPRWSPRLRQGDILGPILVPLVGNQFEVISQSRSVVDQSPGPDVRQVILRAERRLVTVVSHDCEFNEEKRNKLLVARLQDVPGNLDAQALQALRASNDIFARQAADEPVAGVDNFMFDAIPGIFENDQVAAFTTITPLPMDMAVELVAVKRAELDHPIRLQFKAKVAWFFFRGDDDIPDEEKHPAPGADTPPA